MAHHTFRDLDDVERDLRRRLVLLAMADLSRTSCSSTRSVKSFRDLFQLCSHALAPSHESMFWFAGTVATLSLLISRHFDRYLKRFRIRPTVTTTIMGRVGRASTQPGDGPCHDGSGEFGYRVSVWVVIPTPARIWWTRSLRIVDRYCNHCTQHSSGYACF